MTSSEAKKNADKISIRWKLIFYMTLFVILVLIVTWFFQIFLLETFFRSIKKSEMKEVAESLVKTVENENFTDLAFAEAIDHSLSVTVFKIQDGVAQKMVGVDATGSNMMMALSPERLEQFYQKAIENEGSCYSKIAFGGFEAEEDDFFNKLPFMSDDETISVPVKNLRLVYVQVHSPADGIQYMLLLDTALQPLDSTVRTLNMQYFWVAGIILLAAIGMVLILYRKISAPLILMNDSAKSLARGKYDVEFSGNGYRETYELADTLNYASRELSRVDRLQKELIANISHDLRTPLTMIKGYSEVMRDLPGENTPENMQVIIDETTRLSELVNDLLDLSQMQAGARVPKMERFDLTATVREVLTRYDTLVKHRGYQLHFEADDESIWICADQKMILQALYNLINNAINYSGDLRYVSVYQTKCDYGVRISVTDTGEGIAPDQLPFIWDRYYKVDKIHRQTMVGTGLGLSIVKEVLELHHAKYGVISTPGKGSTFWFELPIVEGPST